MKNITIIGSGSFGCALAIHLAKNGHLVKIWSFSEEECNLINKEKKCMFLKNVTLPENITCFTDYKSAINESDIILHVTPSKFFRNTLNQYKKYITSQPVLICSKGFENNTLLTLDEVFSLEIKNIKFGVLSGPSHAEELSLGLPTAMVIASKSNDLNKFVFNLFKNDSMKIYVSNDIKGVEVGGALKNIIALCAGIISGLKLGDNALSALATRGLNEISKLGTILGGEKNTFYGLSGLGDLILTCISPHSRNRQAGILIANGNNLSEVRKKVGMTIESIDNLEAAYKLSKKHNVDLPIINTAYNVIFNNLDINKAINFLMSNPTIIE